MWLLRLLLLAETARIHNRLLRRLRWTACEHAQTSYEQQQPGRYDKRTQRKHVTLEEGLRRSAAHWNIGRIGSAACSMLLLLLLLRLLLLTHLLLVRKLLRSKRLLLLLLRVERLRLRLRL